MRALRTRLGPGLVTLNEAGAGSSSAAESAEAFDPGPQGVQDTRADGFATAIATEASHGWEDGGQSCSFLVHVALSQGVVGEVPRALTEAFGLDDGAKLAVAFRGDESLELGRHIPVDGDPAVELLDEVAFPAQRW